MLSWLLRFGNVRRPRDCVESVLLSEADPGFPIGATQSLGLANTLFCPFSKNIPNQIEKKLRRVNRRVSTIDPGAIDFGIRF